MHFLSLLLFIAHRQRGAAVARAADQGPKVVRTKDRRVGTKVQRHDDDEVWKDDRFGETRGRHRQQKFGRTQRKDENE